MEYGATREIWLAPLATPSSKSSFLIRDDARTKQAVQLGKTVRLGEPTTLGPQSTWRQTSWIGGAGQKVWRDNEMFEETTLDVFSDPGKVKLHRTLGELKTDTGRLHINRIALGRNAADAGRTTPVDLYMGEDEQDGLYSVSGGFKLYNSHPGSGVALITNFDAGVRAFSPLDDGSAAIYIGLANGKIQKLVPPSTVSLDHTDPSASISENSMIAYGGSLFWLAGGTFRKRTNDAGTVKYQTVGAVAAAALCRGICVWNNRIWFGSMTNGRIARLHVSDGVTVTQALTFPDEFEIEGMVPHNGSLYIYGGRAGSDRTSFIGQMWRYTGSTLKRIWEEGTGEDGEDHTVYDAAVNRGVLYWTRNGTTTNSYRYGLMMYDSELDSVTTGPTDSIATAACLVRSLDIYNQTLVLSVYSPSLDVWAVRPVAELGKVKRTTADVEGYLLSSRYDGELPGEQKVWLNARVRCQIASASTEIAFQVILDDGSAQTISTIAYDATATGYRTVTIPLKAASAYLRSTTIQYKLILRNKVADITTTGNPIVDSVEIDFFSSPVARYRYGYRVLASDAQLRLAGGANPLATASALETKLKDFYEAGVPLLLWDAEADGVTPVATGTEVQMVEFASNSYRIDTLGTEVASDVSIQLQSF